ncbi:hypothetical protein [Marinobacter sp. P4B1]|uniref:hypothetical protein n=1 Tax=Marinobacter sp. P4B1 TaxID=1119533 RepID=UPI00071D14AD|nr:hypothetical protein [Marinobacter sp. P4B1]KRW83759.1 hypothetical protein AQ621_17060 [Marinobacter sp. P4B1]
MIHSILQSAEGQRVVLEIDQDEALNLWRYAPGAKKPKLIRVPKKLCEQQKPEKELEVRVAKLTAQGFFVSESEEAENASDEPTENPDHSISWRLEGVVKQAWLPDDLRKVSAIENDSLVLRIEGLKKIAFKQSAKTRAISAGSQTTLSAMVPLLRLKETLRNHGVEMQIIHENEKQDQFVENVTVKEAAKVWPELIPELEEHGLRKPQKLGVKTGWVW